MRFAIDGKTYESVTLERVTLADMLRFEQQTADFGRPLAWSQVGTWVDEIQALPRDKRGDHPALMWMIATMVWVARRAAGEDVEFGDAIDVPMSSLKFLPDTQDHQEPANPPKAARRTGTGRAASKRVAPAPEPGLATSEST